MSWPSLVWCRLTGNCVAPLTGLFYLFLAYFSYICLNSYTMIDSLGAALLPARGSHLFFFCIFLISFKSSLWTLKLSKGYGLEKSSYFSIVGLLITKLSPSLCGSIWCFNFVLCLPGEDVNLTIQYLFFLVFFLNNLEGCPPFESLTL